MSLCSFFYFIALSPVPNRKQNFEKKQLMIHKRLFVKTKKTHQLAQKWPVYNFILICSRCYYNWSNLVLLHHTVPLFVGKIKITILHFNLNTHCEYYYGNIIKYGVIGQVHWALVQACIILNQCIIYTNNTYELSI